MKKLFLFAVLVLALFSCNREETILKGADTVAKEFVSSIFFVKHQGFCFVVSGYPGDRHFSFATVPCTPEVLRKAINRSNEDVWPVASTEDERLKTLRKYGFYYYEPRAGLCFRAVLFYQAVSETQVECTKGVQKLLVNQKEYDADQDRAEEGAR
jgi:hypothetical protein